MSLAERGGGAEKMFWTYLRHADRSRVRPSVVFLRHGALEREVAGLGISTTVIELAPYRRVLRNASTVRQLAVHLRRTRPDVVVGWLARAHLYAAPAAALAGLRHRVVFWQHMLPDSWRDRVPAMLPTAAVATSSYAVAEAQGRVRPHRRTFTVHPGIDLPEVAPAAEVQAVRDAHGIPDGRPLIGIVARLQPWKGQELFLETLAAVRRRGVDVHGLVVGGDAHGFDPEFPPFLRRRAGELGIADAVTFTGHVGDPTAYTRALAVLVNCCVREPFGIAMVEAMAQAVPVVAVDAPGPREIVDQGVSGHVVEAVGAEAMADAVASLLDDEETRRQMGEAGRRRAHDLFGAPRMATEIERRLEEVAER
jgi:glycosyltransferase involved in cell wall biosynthesis